MRVRPFLLSACLVVQSVAATACDTALVLTIDVSNSVDPAEYRLQVDGLADALQDPEIVEAMVRGDVAITVVQWSGETDQHVAIPWRQVRTALDARSLAEQSRAMERAYSLSNTAPAEAVFFAIDQFRTAPDCVRRVIDVSGDGTPNAGSNPTAARQAAIRAGITINAIAIESLGLAITGFYQRQVITNDGFVITARTHRDYPAAIRRKLIRELTQPLG